MNHLTQTQEKTIVKDIHRIADSLEQMVKLFGKKSQGEETRKFSKDSNE